MTACRVMLFMPGMREGGGCVLLIWREFLSSHSALVIAPRVVAAGLPWLCPPSADPMHKYIGGSLATSVSHRTRSLDSGLLLSIRYK